MRVLLVAAPGAGKGTQANRIAERYSIRHISSGELLRNHVERGTAIGTNVAAFLARGDLVPDEVVISVLAEPVLEAAVAGGYVLDGFPRTAHQAKIARELATPRHTEVQIVLSLEVPSDELLQRLMKRADVENREDDSEATIRHRLDVFDESCNDLLAYYDELGILHRIDGLGSIDDVSTRVWNVLDPMSRADATA